jgi:hypothetical protein
VRRQGQHYAPAALYPPLPRKIPGTRLEVLGKLKKFHGLIRNRTRDPPASIIVPQQTMLLCASIKCGTVQCNEVEYNNSVMCYSTIEHDMAYRIAV